MKNFAKLALAAAVVLPTVFVGCKKGENDPFLSFRSRKGRVAGEWKVTEGSGTTTSSFGGSSYTSTWTYDGATRTETSGGSSSTSKETMNFTFDKDGTFTATMVGTETIDTDTYTTTENASGTWNFTGGVGETKNKSQIIMATTSYTSNTTPGGTATTQTYTGSNAPTEIWDIDQLKNKEMIVKWAGSASSSGSSSSSEGTYTLTQE